MINTRSQKIENFFNSRSRELALKHVYLMQEIEELPPGTNILIAKKKEAEALEEELRKKLYEALNSDVLPVLPIKSIKAINPKLAKKLTIPFHFELFSSMNTRIDGFKIEAPTKEEAWKEAEKKAKKYPGKTKLKIS